MNDDLVINENVIDYKYKFPTIDILFTKNTDNNHKKCKENKSYYFILDSNTSQDFGYWIFESFIFVSFLKELNKYNENIKIISKIKNYDIKPLLNYFNINNEIVNEIDNYNNICYSPKIYSVYYFSLLKNDVYYYTCLINYIIYVKANLDINVNKYNYVFVNMNSNNPNYNDEIITKIKNNAKDSFFINDNYENIKYNLSIINNANIIILLYDPSYYYNCIFLENKIIIIVDDDVYRPNGIRAHIKSNPFLDHLFKIIYCKNKIKIMKLDDVSKLF
jgi:hypothetical protein